MLFLPLQTLVWAFFYLSALYDNSALIVAPSRPTAKTLLKHEFLKKKVKDKAYLIKSLLSEHPPLEKRSAKVKRVPGTSGRLHKTEDGGWEW